MKRSITLIFIVGILCSLCFSFNNIPSSDIYINTYNQNIAHFIEAEESLIHTIENGSLSNESDINTIRQQLQSTRYKLKAIDFWLRYLEPTIYKQINGPLPIEWETEVFEKFEKPYKREGAGLTLAQLYLNEKEPSKDSLLKLIKSSSTAIASYQADSVTKNLKSYDHFYLCNRLFLLNLASIYTTGFECPKPEYIIPELRSMLTDTKVIYTAFNQSFPATKLNDEYLSLYNQTVDFVGKSPADFEKFDHFIFIRDYINPLYTLNQKMIRDYKVVSHNLIDYSLNGAANSIFDKNLYTGQNVKGIFLRVKDENDLAEIERLGKLLFYDPILSGNNMRSCASCHKSAQYFTDTATATSLQFDRVNFLPRNTPSLVNVQYNHLIMLDGKHTTLQEQAKAVMTNPIELGGDEKAILKKILSCKEYEKGFEKLLKYTPQEPEIGIEHIASALTYYYSKFSRKYAAFDNAMTQNNEVTDDVKHGFNLFMSKAQCATCHFIPQFNGVKPPYIGSEFEVIGVPADTGFKQISADKGRHLINPAIETMNAFRTGTVRNASKTAPYMHNGIFKTLEQVIDFYNAGGGAGRGLKIDNQTLSSDSLHLSVQDKHNLIAFIKSLDENIEPEQLPAELPKSKIKSLNSRKVGGDY